MRATPLDLDPLLEHLGELLVELLLDAETAPDSPDPSALISQFGQLIEAMHQLEHDSALPASVRAERASALGRTVYLLLERASLRLQRSDSLQNSLITQIHAGFNTWVMQHGGIAIAAISLEHSPLASAADVPTATQRHNTVQPRGTHKITLH